MIDTSPLNKIRHKIISSGITPDKITRNKPPITIKQIVNGMRSLYHYPEEIKKARERATMDRVNEGYEKSGAWYPCKTCNGTGRKSECFKCILAKICKGSDCPCIQCRGSGKADWIQNVMNKGVQND